MNAHNDNNDPFEDIFRDRFTDFESETSEILWNKIEPQLPVKTTRRFPYWQVSALVLGLFLGGFYFSQNKVDENISTLSESNNNGRLPFEESLPYSPHQSLAVVSVPTDNNINKQKQSSVNTGTHSQTTAINISNNGRLPFEGGRLPYSSNQPKNTKIFKEKIRENESFVVIKNISKNPLNPSNSEQSNSIITEKSIFEPNNKDFNGLNNSSDTFESKSVLISKNKSFISTNILSNIESETPPRRTSNIEFVERKTNLSILDTKSYGLLANHFKVAKLKFVTIPKEEPYFKERKPLEFYASAMPLLNYYTITPNGNDANFVHTISVNNDGDRIGFYTQAGLVFTLSDRVKLRTGLTFTKTNHSINYRVRTDSLIVQPADNKGVDISFADLNKTYSQSANYLGTKIDVQYTFLQGEALSHYVSIGGEASYRLNGNQELNGFANFAYGVTRQIGDNTYIFIEPTFSYSLNQQSDNNSLLLVKPNKIGFNIGVNFKLK
ncbi:MAG: hypothetical protein U5N85_12130 [Arcicella sp.]|nr:hypothetical protein [Arcicella sp.]